MSGGHGPRPVERPKQVADSVNIKVNSTNTNGSLKPGQSQNLYQDIGVNSGDARCIKPSDVKILDC